MAMFETAKGDKVKVVACIQDWPPKAENSQRVLDIRTYVKNKAGGWIPTQKGVQIPIDDSDVFSRKLRRLVKSELGE